MTLQTTYAILARYLIGGVLSCAVVSASLGQRPETPAPQPSAIAPTAQTQAASAPPAAAPQKITLQDAIAMARKVEPTYHSAVTAAGLAREDRLQSRDALLPDVNFNTSVLYTQPNSNGGVRYIANNAPREYISQGNVHEQLDPTAFAAYRRSAALAAVATSPVFSKGWEPRGVYPWRSGFSLCGYSQNRPGPNHLPPTVS